MTEPSRVVIVTGGGGSGCGQAIASRFAQDGAAVVVSDVNDAGGHATVAQIARTEGAPRSVMRMCARKTKCAR